MRVLIVEDEEPIAELFRDQVLELGHDAVVARTAEDALHTLDTNEPDAILLDLSLPGLDGLNFLDSPRLKGRAIPIVVVSGKASPVDERDCLRMGALEFVRKPVSLPRLINILGFLELHVLNKHLVDKVRQLDRRRYARAPAAFPVHIIEYDGTERLGSAVNISPFGLKIRCDARLGEGATVKLHFSPPDGPPSLTLLSVLSRTDTEGLAFYFVNLTKAEFHRLSQVVQELTTAVVSRESPREPPPAS